MVFGFSGSVSNSQIAELSVAIDCTIMTAVHQKVFLGLNKLCRQEEIMFDGQEKSNNKQHIQQTTHNNNN
jgi:hypothetical protein